jgi:hypothetical protein
MEDITNKFDHIYKVICSPGFLQMESLGGEIPFFVAAYDAKQENNIQPAIKGLINKLETSGIPALEINLYDLVFEIIEEKGGLQRMFTIEKARSKDKFFRALQSSINLHEVLMPKIALKIAGADAKVYLLTGIGLVFPYIRSHTILNNLQNIAREAPTIAFFPGEYTGHSLNLFGLLKDDNYYRAFNIQNIEIKS